LVVVEYLLNIKEPVDNSKVNLRFSYTTFLLVDMLHKPMGNVDIKFTEMQTITSAVEKRGCVE
jgi:hypothetical protein